MKIYVVLIPNNDVDLLVYMLLVRSVCVCVGMYVYKYIHHVCIQSVCVYTKVYVCQSEYVADADEYLNNERKIFKVILDISKQTNKQDGELWVVYHGNTMMVMC